MNGDIRIPEVRVIDAQGEMAGVISTKDALELAQRDSLDLVEIAPTATPPVCRIIDFGKYMFDRRKHDREQKKSQRQRTARLKEMQISIRISEHDYNYKLERVRSFLETGDRAKVTLSLRGREIQRSSIALTIMNRFAGDLADLSTFEQPPKAEGARRIVMMLSPKKTQ